ncbi:MAG: enoyl-CoA hydratase/isomerase family protein, partial [Clostridia bacterium]|nr:enoyl-CoA hydratase/isomerase family protein [Clostridia bacterium]
LRIAAEGEVFGQPEINVGIMPGAGGTQRLPRLIGPARAKELLFTGDTIDARTALGMGLVNKVVPPGVLLAESRELAKKIAHKSPLIIGLIKQAVNTGLDCPLPAGLSFELQCCAFLFGTEDRNEGMGAFVERRKPVFKGR